MIGFYLSVRALHVMLGAIWLGMAVLFSMFLGPTLREAGPDGGKILTGLVRRRLPTFIASIAGLTVLTGLWLYWKFTNGFETVAAGSGPAHVIGLGAVFGLTAAIIGGSVVARSMKRAVALMQQGKMPEAARSAQRAGGAGRLVMVLLIVAIICMAIGRYM
jgi:hypothetical protein